MFLKYKYYFILFLLVIANTAASLPTFGDTSEAITSQNYFLGTGTGTNTDHALLNAKKSLAHSIQIHLLPTFKHPQIMNDLLSVINKAHHHLIVQTVSSQNIKVAIKQSTYTTYLHTLLSYYDKKLTSFLHLATTQINNNQPLSALHSLSIIITLFDQYNHLLHAYTATSSPPFTPTFTETIAKVEHVRHTLLTNIKILPDTKHTQSKYANQTLSPITIRVTYKGQPLPNATLKVSYGNHKPIGYYTTSKKGTIKLTHISAMHVDPTQLLVTLYSPLISPNIIDNFHHLTIEIPYLVKLKNQLISISITKEDNDTQPFKLIESRITKQLKKWGIKSSKKSTIQLKGTVFKVTEKIIPASSQKKKRYYVQYDMILELTDKNGYSVGTLVQQGKGTHTSNRKARLLALNELKLRKNEFFTLYYQVKPRFNYNPQ